MKKIIILAFIFTVSLTIAQEKAIFQFETEIIDYGNILKDSDGKRFFEFINTGKAPLIITQIQASCGCTIPKKPEKPIMPGEKGIIEVSYDTKRLGGFSKMITIYSNAKTTRKTLRIKGFVKKKNESIEKLNR